jgi:hypothetical protein
MTDKVIKKNNLGQFGENLFLWDYEGKFYKSFKLNRGYYERT